MDDLDHSVLIAEQDWDCFCVESEECSVQQAKLAALDESDFSDSEDEKTFNSTSLPISTSPDQQGQKEHQIEECKTKQSSEKCELTAGYSSSESEPRYREQASNAELNEEECQNKANEDSTEKLGENVENCESKSSQATTEPVSEVTTADIKDSKGGTDVTDSSPAAIKEKERWFVTVNDSPVRLRVKGPTSVQKKRRKKKRSKKNLRMDNTSCLNNETEPEITARLTTCDKSEQEIVSSDSPSIQNVQIQDFSSTEASEDEEERTSCALGLKKESMAEIPKEKLESNPADSPNSLLTPKQLPQMIFKDLSGSLPQHGDHACDKNVKSIEDINCECQHTTDNLSHFNNDVGTGTILGTSKPTAPSLDTEKSDNREESSQKTQSFETTGPTPPIFAISSFWDEMEKLTINDILQLRIANKRSLLTESIIPEESSLVEVVDDNLQYRGEVESKNECLEDGLVDDMADSDYFTHLDDTKPDRSSCEFSTFSDFDDEFIQLLHTSANPSPDPVETKEQRFLEFQSNEIVKVFPESDSLAYMYSETEIQDIFLTTKDDNNVSTFLLDCCNIRRSTPSPVLSVSDILDDQCLLSIFEVSKNGTELEQYQTWIPSRNTPLGFSQNTSLAETYDEFFSDFEVGNFLFPSLQSSTKSEKELVPIYSSSRSVVKDLELSEVDDVMQSDGGNENAQFHASPSETSYMCFITSQRSTWRNLSQRHTTLLMGRTWSRMASSWGFPKTADIVYGSETKTTSSYSLAQPNLPVHLLGNKALRQITGHQIHVGATVADADRDCFVFSLKQADMCLVCIAFASWVLKSSNPQSTDMWKAALLANVSAISAIQYLRRYVKEG